MSKLTIPKLHVPAETSQDRLQRLYSLVEDQLSEVGRGGKRYIRSDELRRAVSTCSDEFLKDALTEIEKRFISSFKEKPAECKAPSVKQRSPVIAGQTYERILTEVIRADDLVQKMLEKNGASALTSEHLGAKRELADGSLAGCFAQLTFAPEARRFNEAKVNAEHAQVRHGSNRRLVMEARRRFSNYLSTYAQDLAQSPRGAEVIRTFLCAELGGTLKANEFSSLNTHIGTIRRDWTRLRCQAKLERKLRKAALPLKGWTGAPKVSERAILRAFGANSLDELIATQEARFKNKTGVTLKEYFDGALLPTVPEIEESASIEP